jgi:uncharacterized protein (TIGR02284 family)
MAFQALEEAIMSTFEDQLATLLTAAIDARNGYQEAFDEADGKGLSGLFAELRDLHDKHAAELGQMLSRRGRTPDKDGSFMSLVHETIMDVRSIIGGLDESVLPGLVDGEKRNVTKYADTLREPLDSRDQEMIARQRTELIAVIDKMETMKAS